MLCVIFAGQTIAGACVSLIVTLNVQFDIFPAESVALNESDDLQRVLKGLQALGVHLSVDDFGTGYSSFDNLARIAWAEIKLDRTITIQTHNARGREMVRSILSF